jgi:hypothetical protein
MLIFGCFHRVDLDSVSNISELHEAGARMCLGKVDLIAYIDAVHTSQISIEIVMNVVWLFFKSLYIYQFNPDIYICVLYT